MTDEASVDTTACPVCGMPNVSPALVCERCGMPLSRAHPIEPVQPTMESPAPPLEPEIPVAVPQPESTVDSVPAQPRAPDTLFDQPAASDAVAEGPIVASTREQDAFSGNIPLDPTITDGMADTAMGQESLSESALAPTFDAAAIAHEPDTATPDGSAAASPEPSPGPPIRPVGSILARLDAATRGHRRDQLGRILLGAVVGLLLLLVLLAVLPPMPHSSQAAQNVPQATVPTPTPQPAQTSPAATAGSAPQKSIVRTVRVLGAAAGLLAPQEAVQLADGTIAVVDTGHKRLVLLNASGKLIKTVTAGAAAFKQPYALAAAGKTLYILDSERDTIERFDAQGQYRGAVFHDPTVHQARGMSLGPNNTLLVANPSTNSILTISRRGTMLHTLGGSVGSGSTQLDQPSDVAAGVGRSIYILDNNNRRVQIVNASGAFTGQLPAPASSTLSSAHVLPLPDGRLLVSDPSGSLLLYPPNGGSATRIVLHVRGDLATHISPLGLALTKTGSVLVTDTMGNRLLSISAAQL